MTGNSHSPSHTSTAERELLCISCGYDVRGLATDSNCPECGTDVHRSLHGGALRYADPRWLHRIVLGQRLLSIGLFIALIGAALSISFLFVGGVITAQTSFDAQGPVGDLIFLVLVFGGVVGGLLLAVVGCLLVTMGDPRDTNRERWCSARRLCRWGLAAAVALFVAGQFIAFGATRWSMVLSSTLSYLAMISVAIGIVAALRWLSTLCRRVPDDQTAKRLAAEADSLRTTFALLLAFLLIQHAGGIALGAGATGVAGIINGLMVCLIGITALVLIGHMIYAFTLMIQCSESLRSSFRREASAAMHDLQSSTISKSANSNPGATTQPSSE